MESDTDFPKLAAPARRALAAGGYHRLDDLIHVREADLLKLHGMGRNAVARLKEALSERGKSFADGTG